MGPDHRTDLALQQLEVLLHRFQQLGGLAGGVEVLFQDSGPGVAKEDASNVFEPFFSTKEGGSGLGLTVSYNIIAAHGGSLELVADHGSKRHLGD